MILIETKTKQVEGSRFTKQMSNICRNESQNKDSAETKYD